MWDCRRGRAPHIMPVGSNRSLSPRRSSRARGRRCPAHRLYNPLGRRPVRPAAIPFAIPRHRDNPRDRTGEFFSHRLLPSAHNILARTISRCCVFLSPSHNRITRIGSALGMIEPVAGTMIDPHFKTHRPRFSRRQTGNFARWRCVARCLCAPACPATSPANQRMSRSGEYRSHVIFIRQCVPPSVLCV